jgi:hypothetical protein
MSNSDRDLSGGTPAGQSTQPRAVIHKKILEAAASNPNASMQSLADGISGASADLVERVLDEYGDPAAENQGAEPAANQTDSESGDDSADGESSSAAPTEGDDGQTLIADGAELDRDTNGHDDPTSGEAPAEGPNTAATPESTESNSVDMDESEPERSIEQFEEKQLEVLRAVAEDPHATQDEIAGALDVSRATVSRRVGDIEGFEWSDRAAFVADLFEDASVADGGDPLPARGESVEDLTESVADLTDTVDALSAEVERIESELDESSTDAESETADRPASDESTESAAGADEAESVPEDALADPELAHKVVHACMDADYVSEDEELRLVRAILDGERSA